MAQQNENVRRTDIHLFGTKRSGFLIEKPQKYDELRRQHLENEVLFCDETFSHKRIKLPKGNSRVVWKRPHEFIQNPQFITKGVSRFDVNQGKLGNCWFLVAAANLTLAPKYFSHVVPNDQSFTENYAGIFHFRFDQWFDVVIDDYLPTINDELIYGKSEDSEEFWPALLEKAYAKFYGSYKRLIGGQMTDAMEDLSGGLSEFFSVKDQPQLFEIMNMSYERMSLMGCSIINQFSETESQTANGLLNYHAYSVTAIKKIAINDSDIKLIRLRNPWGNTEWNGSWSDSCPNWSKLPKTLREVLLTKKIDGEFWMSLEDFTANFSNVDICHFNPSAFFFHEDVKKWNCTIFEDKWVSYVNAGGDPTCVTFCKNPQYSFTLDGTEGGNNYRVIISLMQEDRKIYGKKYHSIGFHLYATEILTHRLTEDFFRQDDPPCPIYSKTETCRQMSARLNLLPGKYIIIPSTRKPNTECQYLLRVYSESPANMVKNDDSFGYLDNLIFNRIKRDESNNEYYSLFKKIAVNKDMDSKGLLKALNKRFTRKRYYCLGESEFEFSKDVCKYFVTSWDCNSSGTLEYEEFKIFMEHIYALKELFEQFDKDKSGKLDGFELRNLLRSCGITVNIEQLTKLFRRHGTKGTITFEKFVVCVFDLKP